MTQSLRIVFAGTPEFAACHLRAIVASHHQVLAVYTRPDRPAGRGKKLRIGPVKQLAEAEQLPVYQPATLKTAAAQQELRALAADILVVVAYGLLLPPAVLETPRLGCINVHASLLPRWRGAAPIQRALEAGDSETGITIMQMDAGLDTGNMLLKAACPINEDDTAASLHDRLITLGTPALMETLALLSRGAVSGEAQDERLACYANKITKEEAALDWRRPAYELDRRIRAFYPFPICHTQIGAERLRIHAAQPVEAAHQALPGTILSAGEEGILVACGEQALRLTRLQLPGKKALAAAQVLNGYADLFAPGKQLI
ncbi:methionyl-tRNA formyltransferase [Exilibacterium tricleocarpae]|uniref:Methionyl-tRNA formyltransferase n=2 Tax=Exilibacterium tricleocarpae TaxID=2591008 RepID=A0A545T0E0_9GAMM|nr:methionyl-tRNA formyltransferase [Exilibacterium tricleocarpae]TQV70687.1 methionyl-tRNA formyltransferase [Exilibacterium tricleocarpae]